MNILVLIAKSKMEKCMKCQKYSDTFGTTEGDELNEQNE